MLSKHRILIADDHAIFRAGIKSLLESQPDIEVVGEAVDGLDTISRVNVLKPDLLISDLSMPKLNGTDGIRQIRARFAEMGIIVLTVHKEDEYIRAALTAGANGYVLKDDTQDELIAAIRQVLSKKAYLSPTICKDVVNGYIGDKNKIQYRSSLDILSTREQQVLKLIAEGYRNKQIGQYLSISPKTVEKHRANLMKKLDIHDVSTLTSFALKYGLVNH
ncbi:MAG: response regulator transcription factor [Gammaproteobacteria bacterium]|nr:response regulator transcription factor [Gammaproteobacteria bacterium]